VSRSRLSYWKPADEVAEKSPAAGNQLSQVDAQVVVQVAGRAEEGSSRQVLGLLRRLPVERRGKEQVVLLLEAVQAPVEEQVEPLRRGAEQVEGRIERGEEAPNALVVGHQRRRLQRVVVVARERVDGIGAVRPPPEVVEVRDEGQDDIEGGVGVVIVADAA